MPPRPPDLRGARGSGGRRAASPCRRLVTGTAASGVPTQRRRRRHASTVVRGRVATARGTLFQSFAVQQTRENDTPKN